MDVARKLIVFLFLLLGLAPFSFAQFHKIVSHYSELENALSEGHTLKILMNFNKCTPSINAKAGMNFTLFNQYQINSDGQLKNVIATSTTTLTQHAKFGTVYSYVRLRIFEDNSVEIFSEFIDPKNFKAIDSTPATFLCHLNDGNNHNAITLFDEA